MSLILHFIRGNIVSRRPLLVLKLRFHNGVKISWNQIGFSLIHEIFQYNLFSKDMTSLCVPSHSLSSENRLERRRRKFGGSSPLALLSNAKIQSVLKTLGLN